MAINVVGFKWNGSDENHKYDYEALENIPTTDIGELDIDTTAEQGTDDGDLYRAIDSFSWSSVISGSILSVKKLFTSIITQLKTNTTTLAGLGDAATKTVVNNLERTTDGAVLDARQGQYLKTYVDENKVDKTSIADNLTTNDSTKVLSAKQGKILQDNKVDMTTGLINLNTQASASTVDGALTASLTALGWLSDVTE